MFEGLEIIRVIMVIVGALYLFLGMWFHFLFIQINGFIVGGILGALLGPLLFEEYELLMSIVGFIGLGLIGAAIALFLDLLGVFISGTIIGAIGGGAGYYIAFNSDPSAGIFIFSGIIGGFVLLALYRSWIIGLTSLIGSVFVGIGFNVHPGWWLLFFLIGIGFQSTIYKPSSTDDKTKQVNILSIFSDPKKSTSRIRQDPPGPKPIPNPTLSIMGDNFDTDSANDQLSKIAIESESDKSSDSRDNKPYTLPISSTKKISEDKIRPKQQPITTEIERDLISDNDQIKDKKGSTEINNDTLAKSGVSVSNFNVHKEQSKSANFHSHSPLDIAKIRLANGEISQKEYLAIEKRLLDL